jgi:predicted oxidoreductase
MQGALSPVVAGVWRLREWQFDTPALVRWIEQAIELGVTTFDHADIYGDYGVERAFGDALAAAPSLRDRLQLVTKCGIKLVSPARPLHAIKSYDTSRAHVIAAVEDSLRALRTDRIDLLLIHRPDALMDPDELAHTFEMLRSQGKVLHFGVSNHSPSQFSLLHKRFPLLTNQVEFSPLQLGALSDGTLEQALDLGLPPMIWSPLAGGQLFSASDAQGLRVRDVLETLGRSRGVSAATMAYAWIRRHPSRPILITGSGRIDGLREAVASLQVTLGTEDWYRVWQASTGHPVP